MAGLLDDVVAWIKLFLMAMTAAWIQALIIPTTEKLPTLLSFILTLLIWVLMNADSGSQTKVFFIFPVCHPTFPALVMDQINNGNQECKNFGI